MKKKLRVLIVEDSEDDAIFLIREFQKSGYEIVHERVDTSESMKTALENRPWDLIIADYVLPSFSGLAALNVLKEKAIDLPFIIVSGNIGEDIAVEAMKAGAHDYIVKGKLKRLIPAVERELREAEVRRERRQDEIELEKHRNHLEELVVQRTTELKAANARLQAEIVERKAAEEAIRRVKEEWERTFESVPDLIALLDRDHHIVRVNKAMADKMGVSSQEAVGMRCYECVHGTDAPPAFCPHQMMLRDGKEHTVELHEERLGGDFLVSTTPLFDQEGKMVGSVHVARDITERKKAEKELLRLSQDLEKKVEARTTELKGTNDLLKLEIIERTNAEKSLAKRQQILESIYAIETTFSVSVEDVFDQVAITISNLVNLPYAAVGRVEKGKLTTVSQLIDNDFSREKSIYVFTHPCGIVAREQKSHQYSGKLKELFPEEMKNVEHDYKSYIGMPITDKEGAVIGVICALGPAERIFNNLEIHSIEIFARYLGHEIEHEIMDDQLRVAGEMNLLGRIASGVAHEVRNPLNGILAISEALFQEIGNRPEHLPYLEHIKTQVNRLSVLMKDLLDLGKPLVQSEFTPQPLEQIIRSAIDSLRHSPAHKNRTVNFAPALAGSPVMVKSDAVKLQQVFFNLIHNACDHSPETEPVTVEMTEFAEAEAIVLVIDRGKGINPDQLEKVFEPFFTTRKGGTGLGLSIVKRIVELHKGTVTLINNVPGSGMTAEVRLPLYVQQKHTAI
ncbi:MAG: ATP-binding protein [Chitinispirillaceae bacterium]|jgi:PAS domain S-box-containing protein